MRDVYANIFRSNVQNAPGRDYDAVVYRAIRTIDKLVRKIDRENPKLSCGEFLGRLSAEDEETIRSMALEKGWNVSMNASIGSKVTMVRVYMATEAETSTTASSTPEAACPSDVMEEWIRAIADLANNCRFSSARVSAMPKSKQSNIEQLCLSLGWSLSVEQLTDGIYIYVTKRQP